MAGFRWVDWEYSGWGDPALELADLRWHAALDGLNSAEHNWLRNSYHRPSRDFGFEERLVVWDRPALDAMGARSLALAVERPRGFGS